MKYKINIEKVQTVDEIREYWSKEDYIELLKRFDYPDAEDSDPESLRELLFMAITDFEPGEAAKVILDYKLGEELSEGQIEQISNDMLIDTVCEEYPEMELQSRLFHVNQLLFKAYNGKFPSSSATIINCSITSSNSDSSLDEATILRILNDGLSDRNIVKRLFEEQLNGNAEFPEAENIIWDLEVSENAQYKIITSGNLIKKDEVIASEWEKEIEEDSDK
ncbi:hypothetical protein APR41_00405 [Salegentibacter salinarum]|uniref:Uncharacterized protein n=1 Tax=Salegentibacter salinarum TaxID=447422 RepID=A0A2N0U3A3_9FLAO|nr:hypothetical protein [Salegentibacter salinarum]PKD21483.1 hypothetical protein APR41_00405 [Salegentibacter salinarum]SKB37865.1 hypothetical protein SAMN05660903_00488 [Salegentibacter salinarum]